MLFVYWGEGNELFLPFFQFFTNHQGSFLSVMTFGLIQILRKEDAMDAFTLYAVSVAAGVTVAVIMKIIG